MAAPSGRNLLFTSGEGMTVNLVIPDTRWADLQSPMHSQRSIFPVGPRRKRRTELFAASGRPASNSKNYFVYSYQVQQTG
jgi:hypothetical protein